MVLAVGSNGTVAAVLSLVVKPMAMAGGGPALEAPNSPERRNAEPTRTVSRTP